MNRFLGAIRNANLLQALVAAAVLVFALSPNESQSLKAAQSEAAVLKSLDYTGYLLYSEQMLTRSGPAYDREQLRRAFSDLTKWDTRTFSLSTAMHVYIPTDTTTLEQLDDFFQRSREWFGDVVPESMDSESVMEWDAWAKRIFERGMCASGESALRLPCKNIPPGTRVATVDFSPDMESSMTINTRPDVNTFLFNTKVYTSKSAITRSVTGRLDVTWLAKNPWVFSEKVAVMESTSERLPSPMAWLAASGKPDQRNLMKTLHGQQVFLPALRSIWSVVSALTPQQAVTYLQGRLDNSRQSVTLFGLSLDQRLVLIGGPMGILISSLYLLSLLHMFLIAFDRSKLADGALGLYPWMGLFRDPFSVAASVAVILMLPPLAAGVLVARYATNLGVETVIAIGTTVLTLVVSALTGRALGKLRQRFASAVLSTSSGGEE